MKKGDTLICIKQFTHTNFLTIGGRFHNGMHITITIFKIDDTTKIKSIQNINKESWYHLENYDQRLISKEKLLEHFISKKEQRKEKLLKIQNKLLNR